MVTLNKIYTKTGDGGTTALGDGNRTNKFSLRVTTYGTVDELNSTVGLATQFASDYVLTNLKKIQNDLFDLGADFCKPISLNPENKQATDLRILISQVDRLEKQIDEMNLSLQTLKSFVLPGGSISASHLHLCRTVCRRAERYAVQLGSQELINQDSLKYLNRLSDWFFVAARLENQNGANDTLWVPGSNQ
jgi:cob(I)alamin adenosyltransferase